jgi:hypothetical protein
VTVVRNAVGAHAHQRLDITFVELPASVKHCSQHWVKRTRYGSRACLYSLVPWRTRTERGESVIIFLNVVDSSLRFGCFKAGVALVRSRCCI